jgi:hypothetical protein
MRWTYFCIYLFISVYSITEIKCFINYYADKISVLRWGKHTTAGLKMYMYNAVEYFTNTFFAILHNSLALVYTYCRWELTYMSDPTVNKVTHVGFEDFTVVIIKSSGMWRSVYLVWTYVSEEPIASIFRIEKSASEEPTWADCSHLLTLILSYQLYTAPHPRIRHFSKFCTSLTPYWIDLKR